MTIHRKRTTGCDICERAGRDASTEHHAMMSGNTNMTKGTSASEIAERLAVCGDPVDADSLATWGRHLGEEFANGDPAELREVRRVAVKQVEQLPGIELAERVVDRFLGLRTLYTHNTRWPPPLKDDAFHGLPGEFVLTVLPHSEADPAGLLVNFIVMAGSLFGPAPCVRVESDNHPPRLFAVVVGHTGTGRKGTASSRAISVGEQADPDFRGRVVTGLSSGEGVIYAVRDKVVAGNGVPDEGVPDKRLLVIEPEFSSALRVTSREGNILSPILRNAWDTGWLQTLTKNNPTRATGAHLSIIAHITEEELRRYLKPTEVAGGLANRFLFVCVERSKELPFGGELSDHRIEQLGIELRTAVELAQGIHEVQWAEETRQLWAKDYGPLTAGRPGFLGALTARAAPQVLRVALVYALLDRSSEIKTAHLKAALAVWEYCEASAVYLFGDRVGHPLAEKLLVQLREADPNGLTRTCLHKATSKHASADEMNKALGLLIDLRRARLEVVPTGGRPRNVYFATTPA